MYINVQLLTIVIKYGRVEGEEGDWIRDREGTLFSPGSKGTVQSECEKSARKRIEEGDNVYWERVHNSGGSLVVRQVERLRWALGGLARIC